MTREQFDKLQVGDKVMLYGFTGIITKKGDMTYDAKNKALGGIVSFAWNEGEPL